MMENLSSVGSPVHVDVQYASEVINVPGQAEFLGWVAAALDGLTDPVEVVIRVVDADESASLNESYRDKLGPTNVLSFSMDVPPDVDVPLLGDLVICAPVVQQEALDQGKVEKAHWAHMVVHGVLHLLGYDHDEPDKAGRMEQREIEILERLGYGNPYVEEYT
jgi:probable rRNA maturation factor